MVPIVDPRPDLTDDSILWSLLLEITCGKNLQLAANLHGFRCIGTRLKRNERWGLVMEPILPGNEVETRGEDGEKIKIKATWGSETDWRDRNDYKETAQEYLRPYHRELIAYFKKIGL